MNSRKKRLVCWLERQLTVEQATRLLAADVAEIVPYLSIGWFAGLRRAELGWGIGTQG
jgi:hypothetical protein